MNGRHAFTHHQNTREVGTYQGLDTTTGTIFAHQPQLRVDRDRFNNHIDILGTGILDLLHDFRFLNEVFYRLVLHVSDSFIVHGVDVHNLDSDKLA